MYNFIDIPGVFLHAAGAAFATGREPSGRCSAYCKLTVGMLLVWSWVTVTP